jgi:2-desacetyl-2-hydroxyethyl bacteriochlorophyllide A dehydrogenase
MSQRIIFPARGEVELQSYELPPTGATDLRVKTLYSLVSIGTETTVLHQRYDADSHFARMFSFPQIKTGVLAIGEVEQMGTDVQGFSAGDRVFMRMAHGSHQLLPAERCSLVPAAIDSKSACWCGLAKTAFRAAWAGQFAPGGQVLIIGAGPVGQMTLRWAHAYGMEQIVVVDLSEQRLEHAKRGGATATWCGDLGRHREQVSSMNEGLGPELVIDTTGNPAVFQQALAVLGRFGKLILLGDTGYPGQQKLSSDVMTKGLTIQATHESHDRDGWTQRRIDAWFFESVLAGRFDLSQLITHEFLPQQASQAYALAEEQREQVMGILFDWTFRHTGSCDSVPSG